MSTAHYITGILVLFIALTNCSNTEQIETPSSVVLERNPFSRSNDDGPFAYRTLSEEAMGKWTRSCALCHINGEGGAPVIGDGSQWRDRIAQGYRTVMRHVIQGYNQMPPLGYCMACDEDDFRDMTAFMAGEIQ